MTKNERFLLALLAAVSVIALTGLNAFSLFNAAVDLKEKEKHYLQLSELATKIEPRIKEAEAELARAEIAQNTAAESARKAPDIMAIGEITRRMLSECGIKTLKFDMETTKNADMLIYTIQAEPKKLVTFLRTVKESSWGFLVPRCDIRQAKGSDILEGQLNVGYEH